MIENCTLDQVYRLVLEHRMWEGVGENIGNACMGIGLLVALATVTGLLAIGLMSDYASNSDEFKVLKGAVLVAKLGWFILPVLLAVDVSCTIFSKRLPTDDDLKLIGGYKIGKQIVDSDKSQRLMDAMIKVYESEAANNNANNGQNESGSGH